MGYLTHRHEPRRTALSAILLVEPVAYGPFQQRTHSPDGPLRKIRTLLSVFKSHLS